MVEFKFKKGPAHSNILEHNKQIIRRQNIIRQNIIRQNISNSNCINLVKNTPKNECIQTSHIESKQVIEAQHKEKIAKEELAKIKAKREEAVIAKEKAQQEVVNAKVKAHQEELAKVKAQEEKLVKVKPQSKFVKKKGVPLKKMIDNQKIKKIIDADVPQKFNKDDLENKMISIVKGFMSTYEDSVNSIISKSFKSNDGISTAVTNTLCEVIDQMQALDTSSFDKLSLK
jgi:hypothetical protein